MMRRLLLAAAVLLALAGAHHECSSRPSSGASGQW